MSKTRKVHLLGVAVLTPVLAGHPERAAAGVADVRSEAQSGERIAPASLAVAKLRLERALLALSPAEKLKVAGDRIPLFQSSTPTRSARSGAGQGQGPANPGNLIQCWTVTCAGSCSGTDPGGVGPPITYPIPCLPPTAQCGSVATAVCRAPSRIPSLATPTPTQAPTRSAPRGRSPFTGDNPPFTGDNPPSTGGLPPSRTAPR